MSRTNPRWRELGAGLVSSPVLRAERNTTSLQPFLFRANTLQNALRSSARTQQYLRVAQVRVPVDFLEPGCGPLSRLVTENVGMMAWYRLTGLGFRQPGRYRICSRSKPAPRRCSRSGSSEVPIESVIISGTLPGDSNPICKEPSQARPPAGTTGL